MGSSGPMTSAEKQARYRSRMRQDGAVEVSGWVSAEDADEAREMLARLGQKVKRRSVQESVIDQD